MSTSAAFPNVCDRSLAQGNRSGHRCRLRVRSKLVLVFDAKQFLKTQAGTADAAFDRADRATADFRSFLIGKAGGAYQ